MKKKEKILISTYTYLPDIGGVAKCSLTLVNAFVDKGYEVKVVTSTPFAGKLDESDYEVIRQPNPFTLLRLFFWSDIILFSNLSVKLGWPIIFSFLFKSRFGLFHHSSSAFRNNKNNNFIKKMVASKIINNSIHYVNSKYTIHDGGDFFSDLPVEIIYPIANRKEIPAKIKNGFSDKKNAVFVGRIELEKGPKYLLDNFIDIKEALNVDKLFIIGDGEALDSLKKYNIPAVIFLGAQPLESVYKAMDECSYVFVPSIWYEPFGIVAVEGLAAGAMVISSDRGGLPEACGQLGHLFNFEDKDSFKIAMANAKKKRDLLKSSDKNRSEYFGQVKNHLSTFQAENAANVVLQSMKK